MLINRSAPPVELSASADTGTHEKVIDIFSSFQRGGVLDAPAGSSAVSWQLDQMGFQVTGVEMVVRESLKQLDLQTVACDLNHALPFNDASFDYVCRVESIEHLENPFQLIREFARVLRADI